MKTVGDLDESTGEVNIDKIKKQKQINKETQQLYAMDISLDSEDETESSFEEEEDEDGEKVSVRFLNTRTNLKQLLEHNPQP